MPFFYSSIPDDKNKPCSVVQGLRDVLKYDILRATKTEKICDKNS